MRRAMILMTVAMCGLTAVCAGLAWVFYRLEIHPLAIPWAALGGWQANLAAAGIVKLWSES